MCILGFPVFGLAVMAYLPLDFQTAPPFSFIYQGRSSKDLLPHWKFSHQQRAIKGKGTQHVFTYLDPQTHLRVTCEALEYEDFPAIEWLLRFKNEGKEDTPIIENIQALDAVFVPPAGTLRVILHHNKGSNAQRDDFAPLEKEIKQGTSLRIAPLGGRSSHTTSLPFFHIEFRGKGGVIIAIGWSGQWCASFEGDANSSVKVRAGMELTHLKLYPGEEIRSPRILLLSWKGRDFFIGQNLFRRFIIDHIAPKPLELPFSATGSPRYYDPSLTDIEFNDANEENQIAFAKRFRELELDFDYWWIDAGWFEGKWPNGVGNWFPRKDGFPRGLRPVSEAVKDMGMKGFLLWFEPERVFQGTWLDREHPDWILRLPGNPNGLLNLGNEEARRWLTHHISQMIEREGINVYRHDFNIDPLPFWRSADPEDRQGITEIRYIEGFYAFWDELLRRHPGLIIDNCASGGRRIDLETISRSVALWRTDYQYFEPNGYQCHTYGINYYLPTTSTGCGSPEAYVFRSSMNNGMVVSWNIYAPDFPLEEAKRRIEEFRRVRGLFLGDYYPLTPYSTSDDAFMAYQFYREDLGEGMVLAFRRHLCPVSEIKLNLKGLPAKALFEVIDQDRGERRTLTGRELARGITLRIDKAPGSALLTLRRIQGE